MLRQKVVAVSSEIVASVAAYEAWKVAAAEVVEAVKVKAEEAAAAAAVVRSRPPTKGQRGVSSGVSSPQRPLMKGGKVLSSSGHPSPSITARISTARSTTRESRPSSHRPPSLDLPDAAALSKKFDRILGIKGSSFSNGRSLTKSAPKGYGTRSFIKSATEDFDSALDSLLGISATPPAKATVKPTAKPSSNSAAKAAAEAVEPPVALALRPSGGNHSTSDPPPGKPSPRSFFTGAGRAAAAAAFTSDAADRVSGSSFSSVSSYTDPEPTDFAATNPSLDISKLNYFIAETSPALAAASASLLLPLPSRGEPLEKSSTSMDGLSTRLLPTAMEVGHSAPADGSSADMGSSAEMGSAAEVQLPTLPSKRSWVSNRGALVDGSPLVSPTLETQPSNSQFAKPPTAEDLERVQLESVGDGSMHGRDSTSGRRDAQLKLPTQTQSFMDVNAAEKALTTTAGGVGDDDGLTVGGAPTHPPRVGPVLTRPDQTRPDQTRPDQTTPDQTRPDHTNVSPSLLQHPLLIKVASRSAEIEGPEVRL